VGSNDALLLTPRSSHLTQTWTRKKNIPRTFSFEFFPPGTRKGGSSCAKQSSNSRTQAQVLFRHVRCRGSTREGTYETVKEFRLRASRRAAHFLHGHHAFRTFAALLDGYRQLGIRHLVALRGDLPKMRPRAGIFFTPTSSWPLSAPRPERNSSLKSRLIRNSIRNHRAPSPMCVTS